MSNRESPARPDAQVQYDTPAVEVFEDQDALTVSADLPGVAPEDVEVAFDQGQLTLSGRVSAAMPPRVYRRRFRLADAAAYDVEHVTAVVRNGVLDIRVPKSAAARPRQIPITVH
jgi:HSP20 family protein